MSGCPEPDMPAVCTSSGGSMPPLPAIDNRSGQPVENHEAFLPFFTR